MRLYDVHVHVHVTCVCVCVCGMQNINAYVCCRIHPPAFLSLSPSPVDMDAKQVVFIKNGVQICSAGNLVVNTRPFVSLGNADSLVTLM